jgi:Domain of unknown function (DUF4271)
MSIVPHLRFSSHEVWVTLLLFFCLLLFAWVRISNPKKIPSLVLGFFRGGFTEEKTITPDSIALFFIFICSASLLIVQALQLHSIKARFGIGEQFLLVSAILLVYYLLKTIALFLCGTIFQVERDAGDYISEIYSSAHLAAIGFFPAIVILIFVNNINDPLFEKGILTLLMLFFAYRTIKMFILMVNRGLSILYLFLYLCTLEIIPVIILFEYGKGVNL